MLWLWVTLSILLLVILIVMFLHIHIHVQYKRRQENDRFIVELSALFGLFKYSLELPVIQFKGLEGVEFKTGTSTNNVMNQNKKEWDWEVGFHKVMEIVDRAKALLKHTYGMMDWSKDTMKHVKCVQLRWKTKLGVGDAAYTGVSVGIVWGIKSWFIGFLSSRLSMKAFPMLDVEPLYNQTALVLEGEARFRIRTFHAVVAMIHLLRRIIKTKDGLRYWIRTVRHRLSS
ncbi:DUF2953 domain-containing protein [Marinicrinis lubricantis]|uniref:DUF2953 domain-containing protein n=1 Tax=Marinicrinis lubricantis TaxID=2086470 RepID=A0ABW1ISL2_9BACL